jgi:hypothetical protein
MWFRALAEHCCGTFAQYINQVDPSQLNWYGFASAALAIRAIERQWGLDQILNDLNGQDEGATLATGAAFNEGGWDQFHALTALPYVGLVADFTPDFESKRTYQPSDVWINGTGPLSSQLPDVTGWAETTIWPDKFVLPPDQSLSNATLERFGLDQATRETIGGDVPWYDVSNPNLPRVPLINSFSQIWIGYVKVPTKCAMAKWTAYLAGVVVFIMSKSPLGVAFPQYLIAAGAIGLIMTGVSLIYC